MPGRQLPAGRFSGPLITTVGVLFVAVGCLLVTGCDGAGGQPHGSAEPSGAARGPSQGQAASSATGVVPVPSVSATPSGRGQRGGTGVRLLAAAAAAGATVSYQGVEIISSWGLGGDVTTVADVWHRSGGRTFTQTAEAGASSQGQPYISADSKAQTPEGVLGVTKRLVSLISANYQVAYVGTGSVAGRVAQIVEVRRSGGGLAARFWLDRTTKLPLRREVFDADARLVGEDVFIDVKVGRKAAATAPPVAADRTASSRPWHDLSSRHLQKLRSKGWPVPPRRLRGLSRFDADEASTKGGPVLDLAYSDGLSVVSIFLQHGQLPPHLAGWQKITVDGRRVYASRPDKRSLAWASHGYVYTVLSEAPPATVDAVLSRLPRPRPPSLLGRLSRGLHRMASWADPFK